MNTSSRVWTLSALAVINLAMLSASAFSQVGDAVDGPVVNLVDGPVHVVPRFELPAELRNSSNSGQAQQADSDFNNRSSGLQFYAADYTALGGKQVTFRIVGTNPAFGANTTTIRTILVPLKFIFPNAGNPTLDGTNVIAATQNSPIFQSADYTAKSVDLGVTQYGDALQRAEFWNLPGFSQNYHVLLGSPDVAPTVTITVPSTTAGNAFPLAGGGFIGVLDPGFFNQVLAGLLPAYKANELPIFTTDNVYLGTNGSINNCCILGFHSSQGADKKGSVAKTQTWIYAAYAEPGTLSDPTGAGFIDVVPLSHETAEWLNDPFVSASPGINWIPPAVLPGQGGACIPNFETGDPLESVPWTFTKTTNGTVYHVQDEVVLPWYLHTTPSFSVNGWYTFQNKSAVIPLVVNSPASIAGTYTNTAQLSFAPVNKTATGNVVYVGRGCPAGSINGNPAADPYLANPSGNIALIDRGACAVSLKIDRAVQAGATGVLIGLVAPGNAISFSYGGGTHFAPSLVITQATSNLIKGALGSSAVNVTLSPDNAIPTPPSTLCGPG